MLEINAVMIVFFSLSLFPAIADRAVRHVSFFKLRGHYYRTSDSRYSAVSLVGR